MLDGKMDAKQFGTAMSTIAHGQAMMAAVRDYQKEMLAGQQQEEAQMQALNVADMLDDAELQSLHAERIARMKAETEKRAEMKMKGHGTYGEIEEGEFLETVTRTENTVVHFFHREFERCKIMDKHMSILAAKHFKTRFIKLCAPTAPFFTVKLNIKTLPCIVAFKNGVTVGRVTGFEGLGGKDDFATEHLEQQLAAFGVVEEVVNDERDRDEHLDRANNIRKSSGYHRTESDEDSDFDD